MQQGAQQAVWPAAIIFDLDGTLVDSAPDIAASVNEVLGGKGLPPLELEAIKHMMGGGIRVLVQQALAAHGVATDGVDQLMEDMLNVYSTRATLLTQPFDGAREVLAEFHAAGIKMAVCTNKHQDVSDLIVRELGLERYFAAVVGFGPHVERKPSPAMLNRALGVMGVAGGNAVMVGDSGADSGAARAAGMPVVLAEFGYAPPGSIKELAPDGVFAHFTELPTVLASLRR